MAVGVGGGAWLNPVTVTAAEPGAVIDAWMNAQSELQTWSAGFTQTRSLKALSQPLVSTGRVWFAAPNRFRWELGEPAQTIAVRDLDQMLVIYPRLKRAERYPLTGPEAGMMGEALALLDAGFPRGRAAFDARFRLLTLVETNGAWRMDLQPVSAGARRVMPSLMVTVATNDFRLLANEVVFPDGSRMRNDFTNATLNGPVDDRLFRPTLGPDILVTEPLAR